MEGLSFIPAGLLLTVFLIATVLFAYALGLRKECQELRRRHAEHLQKEQQLNDSLGVLTSQLHQSQMKQNSLETALEHEQQAFSDKLKIIQQSEEALRDAFKSLSADSLKSNSESFVQLAETVFSRFEAKANERFTSKEKAIEGLVLPIQKSLESFNQAVHEIEKKRIGAYEGISQQVKGLISSQQILQQETASLASALKSPTARGQWGELQLRRVVELAGMLAHCDFTEQSAFADSETGSSLRPDMVVRLPGGQSIVIDAKAPLKAYFEAAETENEQHRRTLLKEHALLIRKQIQALSQKSYWNQLEGSPEFVLLFLPGESYYSAALQADPALLELGAANKVILATPTSLIALLKTAALAWRQDSINENARAIAKLGRELYQRTADLSTHISDVGRHLKATVSSYNRAVGTLESRFFVSARRFKELHADDPKKEIKTPEPLDLIPRHHEPADT